jgi:hypothetical protein
MMALLLLERLAWTLTSRFFWPGAGQGLAGETFASAALTALLGTFLWIWMAPRVRRNLYHPHGSLS